MRAGRATQRGAGASGIFLSLVAVALVLTVLFKLGPAYMGFWTLKSIMDGMAESREPILGGKSAILKQLNGQMSVNDLKGVAPDAFQIKKSGDESYDVKVDYERREHLFANVDAVMTFSHAVVVKGR